MTPEDKRRLRGRSACRERTRIQARVARWNGFARLFGLAALSRATHGQNVFGG
jgi:hypothetical protein